MLAVVGEDSDSPQKGRPLLNERGLVSIGVHGLKVSLDQLCGKASGPP